MDLFYASGLTYFDRSGGDVDSGHVNSGLLQIQGMTSGATPNVENASASKIDRLLFRWRPLTAIAKVVAGRRATTHKSIIALDNFGDRPTGPVVVEQVLAKRIRKLVGDRY